MVNHGAHETCQVCTSGLQYFPSTRLRQSGRRLTDHLGSTVATTDSNGTLTSQQRYLPFGGTRTNVTIAYPLGTPNSPGTDFGYTGQRQLDAGMGGLMDYKARFYSPMLGRFVQPDTIVPDPYNPQDWNRYAYARNNPVKYTDPSGHSVDCGLGDPYCDRGEYTPGGLMRLYGNKNREKLILEIDDYVRAHPDYDYKDDTYLGFSMGDNRDLKYKDLRLEYWQNRLKDAGVCESQYFCVDPAMKLFEYYDEHQLDIKGPEIWNSARVSWASVTLDIAGIPLSLVGIGRLKPSSQAGARILGMTGILDTSVSLATANNPMYQLIALGSGVPVAGAIFSVNLLVWDIASGIENTPYVPPIVR